MRILQINACYERGSTGRMMKEMHQFFLNCGYDSYVCSPSCNANDSRVINIGCKLDYLLHSFFSRLFGLQGYFSILSTLSLVKKIKEIKPDIIHLHNLHSNYINLPILFHYLKKNNVATAITLHDFWFVTGHCCYYTNDNCMKWVQECGKCPAIKTYNKSYFFDNSSFLRAQKEKYFVGLHKLAVIGNSKWTTDEARKSFLRSALVLDHVYNWINTDVFYPRDKSLCRTKYHFSDDDFIILGVAQGWNSLKGLHIFLELAKRKVDHKFVLVGELHEKCQLPKNVQFVGTIRDTNELAEFYSLADIYLNPSVQETFGLVTVEAISCGLPVIANNATATPELVLPGCGYIIDNNDLDQIEECIRKRKQEFFNPHDLHDLACKNFSKNNIFHYVNIYKKILGHD